MSGGGPSARHTSENDSHVTFETNVNATGKNKDVLAKHAERQPQTPAIVEDFPDGYRRVMTYKAFNGEVNRIANSLLRLGFKSGDRLAWCGRNSAEVLIVQQAIRKLGGQSVALNPRLTAHEVKLILEASEARFVWADEDATDLFLEVQTGGTESRLIVGYYEVADGQLRGEDITSGVTQEEPMGCAESPFGRPISFTSGTTGKPRGVMRPLLLPGCSELRLLAEMWGPAPHVCLTSGSLTHGGPGRTAMHALARGDTVIVQRKFDPVDWLRLVDLYKVTLSYCAPIIIRDVCNLPAEVKAGYDRSSIRCIVAGAARWPYRLKLMYREDFPNDTLWEVYGSTELGSTTVMRPAEHWDKPDACGKPVPGVDIVLVGPDGRRISTPYQRGLLYAKSDSLFEGYVGDQSAFEAARWGDGYFTSGDVAYFDEDGYFYICDREKDMIVSGGVNIYPGEIEAVVETCAGVLECAVVGVPDDRWGEVVHAVIIPKETGQLSAEIVIAHCRTYLAPYKLPRSIEFVSELPRTSSGKVRKRDLRSRYWAGTGRSV